MSHSDCEIKVKILQAAKKLFAKQGFDGTSVREICEEAGANVALVSYHFGGKDQLFAALFRSLVPLERLQIIEELKPDPVAGIKRLLEEMIRFLHLNPDITRIAFQEVMMDTRRAVHLQPLMQPMWRIMREMLKDGRERGIFRFESLDNTLVMVMATVIFPKRTVIFESLLEEAPNVEMVIASTWRFVFAGLGASERLEELI